MTTLENCIQRLKLFKKDRQHETLWTTIQSVQLNEHYDVLCYGEEMKRQLDEHVEREEQLPTSFDVGSVEEHVHDHTGVFLKTVHPKGVSFLPMARCTLDTFVQEDMLCHSVSFCLQDEWAIEEKIYSLVVKPKYATPRAPLKLTLMVGTPAGISGLFPRYNYSSDRFAMSLNKFRFDTTCTVSTSSSSSPISPPTSVLPAPRSPEHDTAQFTEQGLSHIDTYYMGTYCSVLHTDEYPRILFTLGFQADVETSRETLSHTHKSNANRDVHMRKRRESITTVRRTRARPATLPSKRLRF